MTAVSIAMTEGESRFVSSFKRINRQLVDDVVSRFKSGKVDPKNIGNLRRARPRQFSKMKSEIVRTYASEAATAREQVTRELAQQRKWVEDNPAPKLEGKVPPGKRPPPTGKYKRSLRTVFKEIGTEAEAYGELAIDRMWSRLLDEATKTYMSLWQQGVKEEEIWRRVESALSELSETPLEQMGRQASTVAYSSGRDAGAMEALAEGKAAWAVRSEVLDESTCSVCETLDGSEFEIGSPDYYEYMPPAYCDGGANCRGFYVVLDDAFANAVGE